MFWKSTSFQTYFLIAIALGAASLLAVPLVQVARSTNPFACENAGGTINEDTEQCILPIPRITECPEGEWLDVKDNACHPLPTLLIPKDAAISDDDVDNAQGADNASNAQDGD